MFDILFGWRKASKCKKLIRHVQCRLKLLKNKRGSIIRQLREDVAQLLKLGQKQGAFDRVEQLFKDQTIMAAYDLLDHFCEFITINLPYIRRHSDCPNDINEAVSTLIFAAARCGDLPELQMLRKLFGERYGHKFAITAAELLVGNLVNCQMIEKLSVKSIPDDVKLGLLDEIARDYSIRRETIRMMDRFELENQQVYNLPVGNKGPQCQVDERDTQVIYNRTEGADIKSSNNEDTEGKAPPSSSPVCRNCQSQKCLNLTCTSSTAVIVAQPHTDTLDPFLSIPIHKNADTAEKQGELDPSCKPRMTPKVYSGLSNLTSCSSSCLSNPSQQHEVERTTTAPESSYQFPEISVVYLDDIEEFNPTIRDGLSKDQRMFMFKSINMPTRENLETGLPSLPDLDGCSCPEEQIEICEPWDGIAQSRSSRMRTKSSRKRLNGRSLSCGSQVSHSSASPSLSMKDVESTLYYSDHCDYSLNKGLPKHRTQHLKKHQRMMSTEESWNFKVRSQKKELPLHQQDDNTWETKKEFFGEEEKSLFNRIYSWRSFRSCRIDRDMVFDCSLEHPCYFFTSDDKYEVGNMCLKQHRGIQAGMGYLSHYFQQGWRGHCCSSPNENAFEGITAMKHRIYGDAPDYKAVGGNIPIQEMGWDSSPQRDCQYMASLYAVTDSKSHMPKRSLNEELVEQEVVSDFQGSCASSHMPNITRLNEELVEKEVISDFQGSCASSHMPNIRRLNEELVEQEVISDFQGSCTSSHMPNIRRLNEELVEQEVISDFRGSCPSSHAACSCVASPLTQRLKQPPYLRAQTMPPERPKNTTTDKVVRSASYQFKQTDHSTGSSSSSSSSHVHPKLPDYDNLAAKFTALKKEHLQSKFQSG